MFRDLARCTARLKGERYKGAIIAAAAWEKGGVPGRTSDGLPAILSDRHGMMTVQAADESGTLTIKMLLGRKAPAERLAGGDGTLHLEARAEGVAASSIRLKFTAEDVQDFVKDVNDTNALHEGANPLVPGLLIMERLLEVLTDCQKLTMKFKTPVFVGQEVNYRISDSLSEGNVIKLGKARKLLPPSPREGNRVSGGGCVEGRI